MTTLEKLAIILDNIPKDRRDAAQVTLSKFIQMFTEDVTLTPEQEAEIERRLDNPNPRYATEAEMTAIFGKPFPA